MKIKSKINFYYKPFSLMRSHQDMLIWKRLGHPSARAFSERSLIAEHDPKSNFCNLEQYLLSPIHVLKAKWDVDSLLWLSSAAFQAYLSEIFLHLLRFKSSILLHCWAKVMRELSPIDWQPRRLNLFRNPPHLLDIFSITGP